MDLGWLLVLESGSDGIGVVQGEKWAGRALNGEETGKSDLICIFFFVAVKTANQ